MIETPKHWKVGQVYKTGQNSVYMVLNTKDGLSSFWLCNTEDGTDNWVESHTLK